MPEISLATRVKATEDVLFQELQGEAVLLELKSGTYFGLDRVGTRVWRLIGEHGALSEVARAMMDEYDVPEQRCTEDLLALVQRLQEHGLLAIE